MNHFAGGTPPRDSGRYVAVHSATGVQVASDRYAVREEADGLLVESHHSIYGPGMPVREVRLRVDPDWTPRSAEVVVLGQSGSFSVRFEEREAICRFRSPRGEQEDSFPIERQSAWFSVAGGLYFPLHLVRRFRFDDDGPQAFAVFPQGVVEVTRQDDMLDDGERIRCLAVRVAASGQNETMRLQIDSKNNLIRYGIQSQGLVVRREELAC